MDENHPSGFRATQRLGICQRSTVGGLPRGVRLLIEACARTPAFAQDDRTVVLAASESAVRLSPCFVPGTNLLHALFSDERLRALLGDGWRQAAREEMALIASSVLSGGAAAESVVEELAKRSDIFRRMWADRPFAAPRHSGSVKLDHPRNGTMVLRYQRLLVPETSGAILTVFHEQARDTPRLTDGPLDVGVCAAPGS